MSFTFTSQRAKKLLASLCVVAAFSGSMKAQLTGTKNIPGDYPTLALAITDLNTVGVGAGGVTLNVISGNPETAPSGGYAITATGTSANQIVIQGNANTITASGSQASGAINDGIFKIIGGDYITISGFAMQENAANTTTATATNNMTEFGVALFYASLTDGAQNITIQTNTITLNRTYPNTFGIYSNSTHNATAVTTSSTATGAAGGNSNLKIYSNSISNVNMGIVVVGPTAVADQNMGLDIGGSSAAQGNSVSNFGTTGTFSAYANVSTTVNGILVRNTNNYNISYNTVTSSNGGVTAGTVRAIYVPAYSNTPTGSASNTINNNSVSVKSAVAAGLIQGIIVESGTASNTATLSISNNDFNNFGHTVAASGSITFILGQVPVALFNVNSNTFTGMGVNTTGSVTFINHSYTIPSTGMSSITNNSVVTSFSKSGAGGSVIFATTSGSSGTGAVNNYLNNNFSNIAVTGLTSITGFSNNDGGTGATKTITGNVFSNWTGGTSSITGMSFSYWNGVSSLSNNSITNITGQSTITGININSFANNATSLSIASNTINTISSTGTGGSVTGISCSNSSPLVDINNNFINTLSTTGGSLVRGISISGSSQTNVFKNKIYNLSGSNAGSTVNGIVVSGGTTINTYNNIIGDLKTPAGSAANPIIGINITGGTTDNVYYNTVFLNATSTGATFGSSAVSINTTPTTITFRNNIFINNSTPSGAGISVAFRSSAASPANYAGSSNNNLFYAGTPSATTGIFYDGTTVQQTLAAYKTLMGTKDDFSVTENVPFASTTGSAANFLHINNGTSTQVESGAVNIASYTDDYDGDIRQGNAGYTGTGSAPDIGADEFGGISPAPAVNSVSISPTGSNFCVAAPRNITAVVTPGASALTAVNVDYSWNGVAQTPIAMTGGNLSAASTWTATIPVAVPANALVTWTVIATDGTYTKTAVGTSYADAPLTGITITATASINPVCAGSPTSLFGAVSSASTPTYTAPPAVVYPTTDEDLGNVTFGSLNNTTARNSLVGTIGTAAGTAGSYSDFTAFGPYDFTAGQTYSISLSTLQATTAYGNAVGVYIDYNRNGVFTDPGEAAYVSPGTTSGAHTETASITIPASALNGNTRMRIVCNEGNVTGPAMTVYYGEYEEYTLRIINFASYSWTDGVTTVGTTNPLSVTPASNTTYSLTATDANGCSVTSAPVTVTVVPLPSAPTATNSSQCGVGVPTAQVGGGTTYNWYSTPTTTTTIQTGTSNTYTTSISSTTTFYVTSVNGACESPRTALTASVSIPDGVVASSNVPGVCPGGSFTLTATQTGTTNPYVFSWSASPSAGSGMPTSVSGATVVVTPTITGTYVYTVTATDGICTTTSSVSVALNSSPLTPVVTPSTSTSICLGSSQVITAVAGTNTIFSEMFETFPLTQFTTTGTGVTAAQNSTYYEQGANSVLLTYAASADGQLATSSNINLSAFNNPKLTFYHICATEAGYDYGYIQYSTDGGVTWTSFPTSSYTGTGTLKNGVVSFDKSSYAAWSSQFTSSTSTPGTGPATALWQLETINLTAYQSSTQFRVRFRLTSDPSVNYYGWLIDNVTISAQSPANFSWASSANSGLPGSAATPSAANGSLTITPTAAGAYVYTATATNAAGCTSPTAITATVTVNPLPSAPTTTNSLQCGLGLPPATVGGSPSYIWYSSPTSTVVLQSGTSTTYTTAINNTTTFYVSAYSGTCESATRTAVTASVTTPDGVSASATATAICPGNSTTLVATQTGTTNAYMFTWTASPAAGSGIPTSVTGMTTMVTPTMTGTYVYTVTASDGVCTTTSSVSVTMNPSPNISNVSATPSVVCSGATSTLNAISINGAAGTATVGTGVSSSITGGPFRSGAGSDNKAQYLFTAAELNAAGIQAGNITALSFSVTSLGSGTMNNWTLKIGTTASTNITTTFDPATLSTVYGPVGYTAVAGLNTFTFAAPFNWDGVSNIIVQVCHDATSSGSSSVEMASVANTSIYTLITGACAQTAGTSNSPNRPVIVFNGIVGTNVSSSINWMWNPGAISTNTAVVNPVNTGTTPATQVYTVTATNPVTTCTNSAMVTVTVNPLPATPAAFNSVQCGVGVPTASVSGSTSYNWYNAATSGTLIQSGASQTYTSSISSTTTFYVAGFNGTCEGPRTAVTASVNVPDAVTASVSTASICPNSSATLTATQTGTTNTYNYTWTASPSAGSGVPSPVTGASVAITPSLSGTYIYTLTAVDGSCTAVSSATLNVYQAITTPPGITASPNPLCAGGTVTLTGTFGSTTAPVYTPPPAVSNPTTDEDCGNVTLGSLNNTSAINSLVGTIGTATGTAGSYSDFTAFGPFPIMAGNTYSLSVSVLQGATAYNNAVGVYIDYNRNGVFTDPGEAVYVSPGTTAGAHTETASIVIPSNASYGLAHMRVVVNEGIVTGPTMNVSWGEYEEYMLNIMPNVTYSWTDGVSTVGTTNPLMLSPASNTTYSFSIIDGHGCSINSVASTVSVTPNPTVTAMSSATTSCAGSPVTLTASGATNYTWTPGSQTTGSVVVTPTTSTTYTVIGMTSGCSSTNTVALSVVPVPTVTAATSNTSICSGQSSATLTANGASSYSWMPGGQLTSSVVVSPTVTTTYSVVGTATTGCSATGTVNLVVNNVPALSVSPASPTICAGSTATLIGIGAVTYTWSSGITTNTTVVTPTTTTTYTLTGGNSCGTSTTTAVVNTVTTPTVTAMVSSSSLCAGSSATITAMGAATYSWSTGSFASSIVVTPTATVTNYTVNGINACGSATAVASVTVHPIPVVTAVSSRTSICTGDFAVLTASGATNYTWTPGGLSTASITVTPSVTTTYTVTGGTAGCVSTATVSQLVLPCTGIEEFSVSGIDIYPNPNIGSVNITIPSELVGHSSIQVFDAVGRLVIRDNLSDAVNHLNTSKLEEGLYIYKIYDNNGVVVKIGRMVRNK